MPPKGESLSGPDRERQKAIPSQRTAVVPYTSAGGRRKLMAEREKGREEVPLVGWQQALSSAGQLSAHRRSAIV